MGHRKNSGKRKKINTKYIHQQKEKFQNNNIGFRLKTLEEKNKSTTKKRIEINNIAFRKTEIINETRI